MKDTTQDIRNFFYFKLCLESSLLQNQNRMLNNWMQKSLIPHLHME